MSNRVRGKKNPILCAEGWEQVACRWTGDIFLRKSETFFAQDTNQRLRRIELVTQSNACLRVGRSLTIFRYLSHFCRIRTLSALTFGDYYKRELRKAAEKGVSRKPTKSLHRLHFTFLQKCVIRLISSRNSQRNAVKV